MDDPRPDNPPAHATAPPNAPPNDPSNAEGYDTRTHVVPSRYLTADIPGIGGFIKDRPEDFLVEEVPLYTPSGQGEHIYLFVQKTGLSSFEMVDILAKHFRVRREAIGVAGLKDKHAVTRQVVSIHTPGKTPEDFPMLQHDKIAVLWTDLHANKLRRGHLRGNWFSIRIRGVSPTGVLAARRVLSRLAQVGVPNRIGEQRFGLLENNHLIGRALVLGDFQRATDLLLGPDAAHPEINREGRALYAQGRYREASDAFPRNARPEQRVLLGLERGMDPRRAWGMMDEASASFFLSAFQSAVFNAGLDQRVGEDALGTLVSGDVACKHANDALFDVDDAVAADPDTAQRLARFEISPTGPMWGPAMKRAQGAVDAREVALLSTFGITPQHIMDMRDRRGPVLEGARRALRIPLTNPAVEGGVDEFGSYVRCSFELPRGAFATVVMREVIKPRTESLERDEPEPTPAPEPAPPQ